MTRYGIALKDRHGARRYRSVEGQLYVGAMNCAAHRVFANRQAMMHQIREAFNTVFEQSSERLGLHDVQSSGKVKRAL